MNLRDHQRDSPGKRPYSDRDQVEDRSPSGPDGDALAVGYGDEDERPPGVGELSGGDALREDRGDDRIRADVCAALAASADADASQIEVQVEDGRVTLTGTTADAGTRRAVEDVAAGCRGVRDVRNYVRLDPAARP